VPKSRHSDPMKVQKASFRLSSPVEVSDVGPVRGVRYGNVHDAAMLSAISYQLSAQCLRHIERSKHFGGAESRSSSKRHTRSVPPG
jgi:hypothetical protein